MPNSTAEPKRPKRPEPGRCACGAAVEPLWLEITRSWLQGDQCPACQRREELEAEEREEQRRRRDLLAMGNLPPDAEGWDFATAESRARQLLSPEAFARWWQAACACRTWPPGSRKGLFLKGPTGRGKTVLGYCLLRSAVMDFGKTGLFVTVGEVFEDTKRTWQRDPRAQDLVSRARVVDVLVMDELDPSDLKPWMKRILFAVLDTRIKHKKPTIITTNCGLQEMDSLLADPHERVMSRIMGNFRGVKVEGADFRLLGADSWWVV